MMKEFILTDIYSMTSLIDRYVANDIELWNFNEAYFIRSSTKYSRDTLLHQYIVCSAYNYHHRNFNKNGDLFDESETDYWIDLFNSYEIEIKRPKIKNEDSAIKWMRTEHGKFLQLFENMSQEVFHILFANRKFLLQFNILIAETVKSAEYPNSAITKKGTIKRCHIPNWAKTAIFHRDKGRCVFCNTDLTGLINTLTSSNFDHMVPLDRFGTNDPCNLQLTCERCNKVKAHREISTGNRYHSWW